MLKSGFGQPPGGVAVGWGLLVENPNTRFAALDCTYRITFFDGSGREVEDVLGAIDVIYPGQQLHVGSQFALPEPSEIARIDVTVTPVRFSADVSAAPLVTSESRYVETDLQQVVTAVIENPRAEHLNSLWLGAVVYDERGEIIGGGFGGLQALEARSRAGAVVPVVTGGVPARVEVSARETLGTHPRQPEAALDPVVTYTAAANDPDGLHDGWAALLENPSSEQALVDVWYQATFYDAGGQVVGSSFGVIAVILPEMLTAIGSEGTGAISGTLATSVDVSFYITETRPVKLEGELSVSDVQINSEALSTVVNGKLTSGLPIELSGLQAVALAFDEQDRLITAGSSLLGPITGSGSSDISVRLPIRQTPARVEVYVQLGLIPALGP